MKQNLSLQEALTALDEYGYEKKQTSGLDTARNLSQMKSYLKSLDYSYKRLTTLQTAINELVSEEQEDLAKQENIQTYKTKIINLSRVYGISFDDVVEVMRKQDTQK
ncbi:hypothetical protein [Shewanella sp. Isolate11]|uniref:hypothetical protein n=1 Tax=Shewanella sp. Isolate11 TaxID=2908530 RepID=UPI001EFEC491|nr:hypothetical protein [Shewanella sp. Isolate11]MCG9696540.1 hypothetical protein [Shewanella sp. Isolate11]